MARFAPARLSLSWTAETATTFVVERKALGAAWPAATAAPPADPARLTPSTIAMPGEAKATDAAIDPFATYVYRIRAVGAGTLLSPPSNEITVGPPSVGFSSLTAAPKAMREHDSSQFANLTRVALDANAARDEQFFADHHLWPRSRAIAGPRGQT